MASTGATSKQCAPANPHPSFPRPPHLQTSTAHSADPSPFVATYLCITHLFLIISPLIFQFSLLCRPPSLHPFSSASLKAFHLSTISMPATPSSPRNLQPPSIHRHSTQFLSSPPIFLHLFSSYPPPLSFPPGYLPHPSLCVPSILPSSPSSCPLSRTLPPPHPPLPS